MRRGEEVKVQLQAMLCVTLPTRHPNTSLAPRSNAMLWYAHPTSVVGTTASRDGAQSVPQDHGEERAAPKRSSPLPRLAAAGGDSLT